VRDCAPWGLTMSPASTTASTAEARKAADRLRPLQKFTRPRFGALLRRCELTRRAASNRQAGGHWFEPSTAHSKSPATGFSVLSVGDGLPSRGKDLVRDARIYGLARVAGMAATSVGRSEKPWNRGFRSRAGWLRPCGSSVTRSWSYWGSLHRTATLGGRTSGGLMRRVGARSCDRPLSYPRRANAASRFAFWP
jgi:hypothetical protein